MPTEDLKKKFQSQGYIVMNNIFDQKLLDLVTQYVFFDQMADESNAFYGDKQTLHAYSKYGDPLMETLLIELLPIVEKNTGLSLYPTYSYYRMYYDGDDLLLHKDREACEISATLCINYEYSVKNYSWPIYMNNSAVHQVSGDMVIYRGCDLPHYRDKLSTNSEESWHLQGFFHYVDQNGPFANFKYDQRASVGLSYRTKAT